MTDLVLLAVHFVNGMVATRVYQVTRWRCFLLRANLLLFVSVHHVVHDDRVVTEYAPYGPCTA